MLLWIYIQFIGKMFRWVLFLIRMIYAWTKIPDRVVELNFAKVIHLGLITNWNLNMFYFRKIISSRFAVTKRIHSNNQVHSNNNNNSNIRITYSSYSGFDRLLLIRLKMVDLTAWKQELPSYLYYTRMSISVMPCQNQN